MHGDCGAEVMVREMSVYMYVSKYVCMYLCMSGWMYISSLFVLESR